MLMKKLTMSALAVSVCVAALPAAAGEFLFYAKNGCRGPVVVRYPTGAWFNDNCKAKGNRCSGHNDELRSLFVPNNDLNWGVQLYDSPDANSDDDFANISAGAKLADPSGGICIATFEPSASAPFRRFITYHRKNGLDGKVSHIQITFTPRRP